MMTKKFEFSREGKELRLTMSQANITVGRLASAFEVSSESLFIKEEWGDVTFWPNENGRFNLSNLLDGSSLLVMGQSQANISRNVRDENCLVYTPTNKPPTKYKVPSRPFSTKGKGTATFACKIILANKSGRTFSELDQTYININDDTANVRYISQKVREKWGDNVMLHSSNGLPIQDEEGTRGCKFWKCPSRKVYALKEANIASKRRLGNASEQDSTDEEEEEFHPKRKKNLRSFKEQLTELKEQTINLKEELVATNLNMEECKAMLQDLIVVNKLLPLPPCVVKLVHDAFKCKVCLKSPMKPPIVATRCCNILLGCSECVNEWYTGEGGLDKTCPHCREPRGYAQTCQFKGIDEFLTGFTKLMAKPLDQEQ